MALKVNLAQINAAARGNSDLRETLTAVHLALQSLYAQTGAAPLTRIDTATVAFTQPPTASRLAVTGADGVFTLALTRPAAPGKAVAIQHEISSSPTPDFSAGVLTYPVSSNTAYTFHNPGATLYWRVRSSYNQQQGCCHTRLCKPVELNTLDASQPIGLFPAFPFPAQLAVHGALLDSHHSLQLSSAFSPA